MIEAILMGGDSNMTKWFAVGRNTAPRLRIVDANDGSASDPALQPTFVPGDLDFDPQGQWLAVGGGGTGLGTDLIVYSTVDFSNVFSDDITQIFAVSFSRDGEYLALATAESPYLIIYETSTWTVVPGTPTLSGAGQSLDWSHNGNWLAVGHSGTPYLTVLNTADWSVVAGTPTLAGAGNGVSFSPDDSLLAAGHENSPYLTVSNSGGWSVVSEAPAQAGACNTLDFSPNGEWLMLGITSNSSGNRAVRISDWTTHASGVAYCGSDVQQIGFSRQGSAYFGMGTVLSMGLAKSQKIGYVPDFDLGVLAGGSISAIAVY